MNGGVSARNGRDDNEDEDKDKDELAKQDGEGMLRLRSLLLPHQRRASTSVQRVLCCVRCTTPFRVLACHVFTRVHQEGNAEVDD
jgi:hypothetical protein